MYALKPKLHERQRNHKPGDLRTVALDVTPRCNMKCPHCYAETFANTEPLDIEILRHAFDEFYELGVYHYVMQGGEPIAHPDRLEAILRMCHPDESYINVVSNGWDMSHEMIRWLKELKVDKIAFSLDSGIEAEHDQNRRPGSFKKVKEAIDYVLREGLFASISVVVTNQSLYSEGFCLAYDYALAKGIRMDVQIAEPVGKWDGKKELLMTPADTEFIKKLQLASPILSNGQRMINRDIYCGESDHCPAGTEFMGLTADGQLLPCNFLQISLGNVRDRSIASMRDALLKNPWFNDDHPVCLCGEDPDFIDTYIVPYVDKQKPLNACEVFKLALEEQK
ncbi:MAG: radical SAM protein [Geobacter sp.]|nr:radical SAM protein [Geobacter sp.]